MEVWRYFDEITQIPRPSKREKKIIAYLERFAQEHRLECRKDGVGNILITRPAASGKERVPMVVLQSHVDMVCEKNSTTVHDFENDPIQTYIDGDWMKAKGTTLGADNGIGMAYALAILADRSLQLGTIEGLFTVDEEIGLVGAQSLEKDFFTGKMLINLDSEDFGEVFIGCSGGIDSLAQFKYELQPAPSEYFFFQVSVTGLLGGHSGCDIHLGRANANKLLARYLLILRERYDLKLIAFHGGNLRNAIPREAFCVAAVPFAAKEEVRILLNHFIYDMEQEYLPVEPKLSISLESTEAYPYSIDDRTAANLISALHILPHGVVAMSNQVAEVVETSTNLAAVKMDSSTITVVTSQRSSIESAKSDIASVVKNIFMLLGAEVVQSDGYPGWKPNADSPLLATSQTVFAELFGRPMKVTAIHAGLECGLFAEKYPGLDMISVGPTMKGVHSPDERLHVPSVDRVGEFLVKLLETL